MEKGYKAYRTVNVDTADQGKLILIAYDVAVKHCRLSLELFGDTRRVEERVRHLYKAQSALSELMGALNMEAGEVANNLYRLYEYMLHRLVNANVKNDRGAVEETLGYLTELRDAWSEAIGNLKKEEEPEESSDEGLSQHRFAATG